MDMDKNQIEKLHSMIFSKYHSLRGIFPTEMYNQWMANESILENIRKSRQKLKDQTLKNLALNGEIKEKNEEINNQGQQLDNCQTENQRIAAEIAELKNQIESRKKAIETEQQELNKLNGEMKKQGEKLKNCQAENNRLEDEINQFGTSEQRAKMIGLVDLQEEIENVISEIWKLAETDSFDKMFV